MIDLEAHYGRARKLVGYQDLTQVLERDRVVIEQGDMVCLRTGFAQVLLEMDRSPDPTVVHNVCAGLDGRDDRLQQWVTDSGACRPDFHCAVEMVPARPCDTDHCASFPCTRIVCSGSVSIWARYGI